jgi:predicted nucleic-acid-binding protein
MCAIDTNVLIRLIVQDDASQVEALTRLRQRYARAARRLFVSTTVLLELEWVLRSRFHFNKSQVLHAIERLIASGEIEFEREEAVLAALEGYAQSSADMADCIHAAMAKANERNPFHTFDRKASTLSGAELVS